MQEIDLALGTSVLRLERGEELVKTFLDWAERRRISAATVFGLGALEAVELGYFDRDLKRYERVLVPDVQELLNVAGNLGRLPDGSAIAHLHVTLGARDFSVRGGHLFSGVVAVTAELHVTSYPRALSRGRDPASGLNLIQGPSA